MSVSALGVFPSDEQRAAAQVLVVGDVMLDRYWFGEVHRISPEAPVPVVHVSRSGTGWAGRPTWRAMRRRWGRT